MTVQHLNIPCEERMIDDYPKVKDMLVDLGRKTMPYVVIYDENGKEIDNWSNFQIDKIKEINNKLL